MTVATTSALGQEALQSAQSYYGKVLTSTADLKTSACCSAAPKDVAVRNALKRVHPDVVARFYGCGSPIPPLLRARLASGEAQQLTILDLGCGTGRDCYILSQLLGPSGHVIGLDATEEQRKVAQDCLAWHEENNPDSAPIDYRLGTIEDLAAAGIKDDSVDIITSNCVINLSDDKPRLFAEIFRVLKQGGELFFSDVFANKRLSKEFLRDPVLHGECLAGAMYWPDMLDLIAATGGHGAREVESSDMALYDEALISKLEPGTTFTSKTVRAFKIHPASTSMSKQAYVAALRANSDIDDRVRFDSKTAFNKGKNMQAIDAEIAMLLSSTRYAPFFDVRTLSDNDQTIINEEVDTRSGNGNNVQKCC